MKRPGLVNFLIAVNVLVFLAQIGFAAYLLVLTRSPQVVGGDDPASSIHGLKVAAAIFAVPALFWVLSLLAILRRWAWGGWYGMLLHLGLAALFTFDIVDDWRNADEFSMALVALGLIVAGLYLAGPVRSYFSGRSATIDAELVAGQGI